MLDFPLAKAQAHLEQHHSTMGESYHASFPSCTSTSASRKSSDHEGKLAHASFHLLHKHKLISNNIIQCGGNLACARFPPSTITSRITSFQHGGKLARASFQSCRSTSASRTTSFHHGGKLARASFPSCTSTSASRTTSF
jgi:hypothetical protein